MSRQEKVTALVLSRRNSGEADRLVTFFTKEGGLLRVLAKGVRRIPSRRGGHLEPLTLVSATISGNLDRCYLASIETVDYLPALHADGESLTAAHLLAGVALQLFEYGVPYKRVYTALAYAWEVLPTLSAPRRHALEAAVALLLLKEGGVLPEVSQLSAAGVALSTEAHSLLVMLEQDPRTGLKRAGAVESFEVMQGMRQYIRHAFPLRRATFEFTDALSLRGTYG